MSAGAWRLAALALSGLLVLSIGFATGWNLADSRAHARIEQSAADLSACRAVQDNLQALADEQGQAVAALSAKAEQRREDAQRAQREAQQSAQADYQAANRLQQERTGGDQCVAAEAVIDLELGL